MKKLLFVSMAALLALPMLTSCSSANEDIPDAVETPEDNDKPAVSPYNSLGEDFTPHKEGEPYDTYKGLVMTGYQGWFGTPGDGSLMTKNTNEGWYHYRGDGFRPGVLRNTIDFWPDMTEYEKKYVVGAPYPLWKSSDKSVQQTNSDGTVKTNNYGGNYFLLPNGDYASVFSSFDESTVMLHFKWMQEYGIDGAFMQRFIGEVKGAEHAEHFNTVLKHAMAASNKYQRAIAVMFDMSGNGEGKPESNSNLQFMVDNAKELMNKYQLKDRNVQKYYLHENGKPVLALWGVGFSDTKNYPSPTFLTPYIEQLQEQGWAIMLGCPGYWREGGRDAVSGAEHNALKKLLKKIDAFMPWYVGRFSYDNFSKEEWQTRIKEDIKEAKTYSTADHKVTYAVHMFPGGSDRNMHPNNGYPNGDATNTGYRYGGKFYWQQFYLNIKNGAEALYLGMFDEVDEGTAIFKQMHVSDVPSNVAYKRNVVPQDPKYTWTSTQKEMIDYDGKLEETEVQVGDDYWVNYKSDGGYSATNKEQTSDSYKWSKLASELDIKFQGIDDNLPTDHYLFLSGMGAKMLNGQIKMTGSMPKR